MCEQALGFWNDPEPELFRSRNRTTRQPEWTAWSVHLTVNAYRVSARHQHCCVCFTPPLFSPHLLEESGAQGGEMRNLRTHYRDKCQISIWLPDPRAPVVPPRRCCWKEGVLKFPYPLSISSDYPPGVMSSRGKPPPWFSQAQLHQQGDRTDLGVAQTGSFIIIQTQIIEIRFSPLMYYCPLNSFLAQNICC